MLIWAETNITRKNRLALLFPHTHRGDEEVRRRSQFLQRKAKVCRRMKLSAVSSVTNCQKSPGQKLNNKNREQDEAV